MSKLYGDDYIYEIPDSPSLYHELRAVKESAMFSKNITCDGCGHRGNIEIGAPSTTPRSKLFTHVGHDPHSGDLYFRCPACGAHLSVDPLATVSSDAVTGVTVSVASEVSSSKQGRSLSRFWLALSMGIILYLTVLLIINYFITKT